MSLFLDPEDAQIEAGHAVGADAVELHTGAYANAGFSAESELESLLHASQLTRAAGLTLHSGHGLTYRNVCPGRQCGRQSKL